MNLSNIAKMTLAATAVAALALIAGSSPGKAQVTSSCAAYAQNIADEQAPRDRGLIGGLVTLPLDAETGEIAHPPRPNVAEFTVSEISFALKRTLEETFGHVRVRGEISGFRGPHSSGHCYFSLKDKGARMDAVIWRTSFVRLR